MSLEDIEKTAKAFAELEMKFDWDEVRDALKALITYMSIHEPTAQLEISSIEETLELIPDSFNEDF